MKAFKDKVAVITGAASGIGFGLAERFAKEGMKVVLSGINQDTLDKAAQKLKDTGAELLTVQADVARREDMEALAEKTLERFGAVHLLVNNAGVGAGSTVWGSTWEDWEWVLGVNLWGTIHGLKIFVPIMLAQDTECHILNNASNAGLLPHHASAPYQVSKHAVVALSENLHHTFAHTKAKIKVSVLLPGWVKTRILEAERNRPADLQNAPESVVRSPQEQAIIQRMIESVQSAITPQEYSEYVIRAIREEHFYVISHLQYMEAYKQRFDAILGSGMTLDT